MASSFSMDFGMTTPRSGKVDATTDRTVRDIQKIIDDQFKDEIRTFMGTKYIPGHRGEIIPQKEK